MMWIIIAIGILLIAYLICRKQCCCANSSNEKVNDKTLPQIDIEALESIIPPINENKIKHNIPSENEQKQYTHKDIEDISKERNEIVWTTELMRIKSIMLLSPKHSKRASGSNNSNTNQKHYERYEALNPFEQYELAVLFAELIEEADNLHKMDMFLEERTHCINAIKWCAKEGLSVIYWQSRLNQVNEILGIKPIEIEGKTNNNKGTDKKYLSASDKNELVKNRKEQLEKEYLYYHKLGNIEEAQKVVQKAIKWAEETQQMYYRQKWVERIVTLPEDTSLSIEQRLKEKKRQRHPYNITSTRKPRRPRIKYEPKNTSE
ncbi:MAG: hypothetical protein J6J77_04845 [Alistipes sp.]|nr:hypothetical protein [Alistipes sp.]